MSKVQLLGLYIIKYTVLLSDKISKRITAKLLVNIFFKPRRHKHPSKELSYLESADRFSFQHNNIEVKGYKWGKYSTKRVLLVHGWEGRATQLHQYIEPLIEKGYEVYAYDGIAHGLTAGKETNMPEMSFLLKHMVSSFHINHILAHSFGGMATTFAIKSGAISPESVSFVGAPYDIDYILESFLNKFGLNGKYEEALIKHIEKKVNLTYDKFQFDNYPKTVHTKLLLIHDENDKEVSFNEMRKYLPMWENAEQIVTKGLGHRRILKDREIMDKICSFIEVSSSERQLKGA